MNKHEPNTVLSEGLSFPAKVWLWITNPPAISLPGFSSWWLPGLFLLETFLFLPMDLVLAGYCFKNREQAYPIALICAFCSTCSALVSYLIGFFAWEQFGCKILGFMVKSGWFLKLTALYQQFQFPMVFLGGLLPLPIKAVTISAGFCKLSIPVFLTAMFLARIIRFVGVAYIAQNYGEYAVTMLKNFGKGNYISVLPWLLLITSGK